jgi:hypothetical protein
MIFTNEGKDKFMVQIRMNRDVTLDLSSEFVHVKFCNCDRLLLQVREIR